MHIKVQDGYGWHRRCLTLTEKDLTTWATSLVRQAIRDEIEAALKAYPVIHRKYYPKIPKGGPPCRCPHS